ncbi:PTS sugar transporter subunit IIA, partial [Mesorhizobium sp. M7A.F.Ca.US.001.02.1.1]
MASCPAPQSAAPGASRRPSLLPRLRITARRGRGPADEQAGPRCCSETGQCDAGPADPDRSRPKRRHFGGAGNVGAWGGHPDIILCPSRYEARGALASRVCSPKGAASREAVLAALLRRERRGPTYIGGGIAMPHGRNDESLLPAAAVLRLRQPVHYATADGDMADILVA